MMVCCCFRPQKNAPESCIHRGGIAMLFQQKVKNFPERALLFFGEFAHLDIIKPDGTGCVKHTETEK